MENIKEQIEALKTVIDYIPKLKKGMTTVAGELLGSRQPDTDEYLKKIVDGLNWVIGICNGTLSLINKEEVRIDKDAVNAVCLKFGDAFKANDDAQKAALLSGGLMDFVSLYEEEIKRVLAAEALRKR